MMMMLPIMSSSRTLSISEIHSTLPWDVHQEGQEAQEVQTDQEDLTTHTEDQTQYPPLISFLSNLQETSNLWAFPPSSSMATERTLMPSSKNYEST